MYMSKTGYLFYYYDEVRELCVEYQSPNSCLRKGLV